MSRENHIIVAIHITDRIKKAQDVQKIISDYGCYIKTRLGLHEASDDFCSNNGIILLEMLGNTEKASEMQGKLKEIEGVEVQDIVFDHEADNMA